MVWSLREGSSFTRVRESGRSGRATHVTLKVLRLDDGHPVRLGMAVGRQVGNAVHRNLLRRRLRVIIAEVSEHMIGMAVTIRLLSGATSAPYADLRRSVRSALRQAEVQFT